MIGGWAITEWMWCERCFKQTRVWLQEDSLELLCDECVDLRQSSTRVSDGAGAAPESVVGAVLGSAENSSSGRLLFLNPGPERTELAP